MAGAVVVFSSAGIWAWEGQRIGRSQAKDGRIGEREKLNGSSSEKKSK